MNFMEMLLGPREYPYNSRTLKGFYPFTRKYVYGLTGLITPKLSVAGLKWVLGNLAHFAFEASFRNAMNQPTAWRALLGFKLFGFGASISVSLFDGEHVFAMDSAVYAPFFEALYAVALNTPGQVAYDREQMEQQKVYDAEFAEYQRGLDATKADIMADLTDEERKMLNAVMSRGADAEQDGNAAAYLGKQDDSAAAKPRTRTTRTRRTSGATARKR